MTEPTHGDYDITEVKGFEKLLSAIRKIDRANSHEKRVKLLSDILLNGHNGTAGYLTFGNNKVAKNTGIFNMNSATDCPNADSTEENPSDTGVCQVPWSDCYAHQSENQYDAPLKKRRLQEYLWDCIDADTFADAILHVKNRMTSAFEYLRVSEAGDFRHRGDIIKWNTIARKLSGEIMVYTYSASHKLDWSYAEHFVVNQSNDLDNYGDRSFTATTVNDDGEEVLITDTSQVPDENILCPFEAAKANGIETDKRPKCGDCTACIRPESEQKRDVSVIVH